MNIFRKGFNLCERQVTGSEENSKVAFRSNRSRFCCSTDLESLSNHAGQQGLPVIKSLVSLLVTIGLRFIFTFVRENSRQALHYSITDSTATINSVPVTVRTLCMGLTQAYIQLMLRHRCNVCVHRGWDVQQRQYSRFGVQAPVSACPPHVVTQRTIGYRRWNWWTMNYICRQQQHHTLGYRGRSCS